MTTFALESFMDIPKATCWKHRQTHLHQRRATEKRIRSRATFIMC